MNEYTPGEKAIINELRRIVALLKLVIPEPVPPEESGEDTFSIFRPVGSVTEVRIRHPGA